MAVIATHCPSVRVLVVDSSDAKIARWNSPEASELPIYEPGLHELLLAARDRNLFFSSNAQRCIQLADIVFVCVDTPVKASGLGAGSASDTRNCEDCVRMIARFATSDTVVVEKSTVPVRTAAAMREVLVANSSNNVRFEVVSNPEFLSEGSAVANLESPGRLLIGGASTPTGAAAVEKLVWIYSHWVPRERILTTNIWSSELSKLVANAFLAQRISSINSVSAICEATGADVHEVARAVGMDDRIGRKYLRASVGFGGSSFQKDVLNLVYLAESLSLPEVAEYWRRVVTINDFQKNRFVNTIVRAMFHSVSNKKLCVFGLAYKTNTGDTRETTAGAIIKALLVERAQLAVFDPHVRQEDMVEELTRQGVDEADWRGRLAFFADPYEAAKDAHAVCVLNEWEHLAALEFERIYAQMTKPAFFFDGRNALPHALLRRLGAEVHAIGKVIR
ncbi:hypothetical protein PybrP1_011378 [[Pythium] brassicae (nom. inval.)]|nr:hypothetical protein PybrP1_011378 [[Pythium] brassicae (nom. inval.)]